MSGFLGRRRGPLTRRRALLVLGGLALVATLLALVAPLLITTMDADGRHLVLVSPTAYWQPGLEHDLLVWQRLPRALGALVIGAALAAAGTALQALLRNPLAEPFTLGVSSAASLAAVLAIRLGVAGALGGLGVNLAALIGAAGAVALVAALARTGERLPPATLLLAGVTVSMFCGAASMLVQSTAGFGDVHRMLRWMMGGLDTMRMVSVARAAVPIALGLAILWWRARELNALAAGTDAAAALGVAVGRTQVIVFATSSLLVGTAIALGGPIGFVGLIVPHALRAMLGPDHRLLMPASMLGGGVLLVACDVIARLAIHENRLPVGVVTALLGGPFFVGILLVSKRRAWGAAG